jgi:hypothetical protein
LNSRYCCFCLAPRSTLHSQNGMLTST